MAASGALHDVPIASIDAAVQCRLIAHSTVAVLLRQVRGLVLGAPYPHFSKLLHMRMGEYRSSLMYRPTTLCTHCFGMNRDGVSKLYSPADVTPPRMPDPLKSQTLVPNDSGTRCFTHEQAMARAYSAQSKLGITFSLASIPENLLERFP